MSEQDNVQALQSMYAAFGAGDVPAILGFLSEDAKLHHGGSDVVPWGGRTLEGTAGWEQFFGGLLELFQPERPILDGRALWYASRAVAARGFADDLEVPWIEPPALRPVVQGRAADRIHHWMDSEARRIGR